MKLGECSHNSYWKVAYDGTCMVCRAEQAEARVQTLEAACNEHLELLEKSVQQKVECMYCEDHEKLEQDNARLREALKRLERTCTCERKITRLPDGGISIDSRDHYTWCVHSIAQHALEEGLKRVRLTPKAANDYVAQVEHWKAEAMWAASFIVSLFKAAWEADQSSTYQRAQAILKEA